MLSAIAMIATIGTALLVLAPAATAQRANQRPEALRGSKASVEKMYDFAQRHRYPFYLTPTNVESAIAAGKLVPLTGDSTYELTRGVGFSYATREAKQFVEQFAPQYVAACGAPLTVTSAARPLSRQPRNANQHSVHPTGIAVDLRRPYPGPCLNWVRSALTELERRGIVEATEERHPAHLHLAVLAAPGARIKLPELTNGGGVSRLMTTAPAVMSVSNGDVILPGGGADETIYRVREGDTLWDVAQRTGLSVKAIAAANNRNPRSVLRPGTMLRLPSRGAR
jgi:nucleoid-associated protein YgaU